MERPSRDALLELAKNDPEAIVDLVEKLFDRIEALEEKVAALQKNSSNSSKPPSSDQHNPSRPGKGKARECVVEGGKNCNEFLNGNTSIPVAAMWLIEGFVEDKDFPDSAGHVYVAIK